jgi:DNA-binding beta-propeller fold protein YncE
MRIMFSSMRQRLTPALGIGLTAALLCVTVAWAAPGSLTFVEQDKQGVSGVSGIDAPLDVAASPDGKNVYVAGSGSSAVATFTRDGSGALTFLEADIDNAGGVNGISIAFGVAVSPDGKNVYVTGRNENGLATFNRDPGTGALTFAGAHFDGSGGVDGLALPWGLEVSPDGKNVYVAGQGDAGIATFTRDTGTGALTFLEADKDGVAGVDGLNGITNIEVSPGTGTNLYGASCGGDMAVSAFTRDPSTGAISFLEVHRDGVGGVSGLNCTRDVAVSPDGTSVHSVAESANSVATFIRSASTGALTFLESDAEGGPIDGLQGARDVAITPDCATVYVASAVDDAVAGFSRATNGALTFLEADKDGTGGVDGTNQAVGVTVAPGGANVYAVGEFDDAIATFSREAAPGASCGQPGGGPAARTVTLNASKKKVKKNKKATLSGDISAPQNVAGCESGQAVELQRKRKKKDKDFKAVKTLTSDGSGGFTSKQKIKKTSQFRAVLAASATCDAAQSPTKKVKVKKKKRR